ncbi:hypothetical protein RMSM_02415 [Rhodopirellula maiorica SM1]|uniref:Uncharacterized protein n=2 Tax=Novipirellula TaxID=2795426 RepID=M5RZ21_9BACT|nr:hypothetical protein RMSM_02415 [Rhodopirellula maiorica SM1]
MEFGPPTNSPSDTDSSDADSGDTGPSDASDSSVDPEDEEMLPAPSLNASEAGFRIKWNPVYAREA